MSASLTQSPAAVRSLELAASSAIEAIPLSRIVESPDNPRQYFPKAFIDELAASMLQSGQLTPALVRPHPKKAGDYELAAGATRWRAASQAGLTHLVCVVRAMDDAAFLEALTFENLKRRDLQPMEEARSYATLMKKLEGWTVERIAERSGVSADYVRDRLRLLKLVPEVSVLLEAGRIELGHAVELAKISASDQKRALKDGLFQAEGHAPDELGLLGEHDGQKPRTVRELRAWIDRNVRVDLAHPELEHLLPETAKRLAAAKVEQRKQVYVALGYVDPHVKGQEKVVGPQSWKKAENEAGAATCEYAVLGIVFAGDAARGHAFLVCTNKDRCKRHWPQHVKRREEREKARRGELTSKTGAKVSEAAVVQKQRDQDAKEKAAREARAKAIEAAQPEIVRALAAGVNRLSLPALSAALLRRFQWITRPAADKAMKRTAALVPVGKSAEDTLRRLFWLEHVDELGLSRLDPWVLDDSEFREMAKSVGVDVGAILEKHSPAPKVEPVEPAAPRVPAAVQKKHARVVPKAQATGKPRKVRPAAHFMQPVTPDATLAAIVGAKPLVRTELTKKLWAYITKHGLQDKKNRRMINADEKLKALFGGAAQVSMFDMTKLVGKHLVKKSQGEAA